VDAALDYAMCIRRLRSVLEASSRFYDNVTVHHDLLGVDRANVSGFGVKIPGFLRH
jgi:hypothetical protein